jgi:hypothetical protein
MASVSVLEFGRCYYSVTGVYGRPDALDRLTGHGEFAIRVAEDELLLFSDDPVEIAADASVELVIDLSSGFTILVLQGLDRFEAFRRVSAIAVPNVDGVVQGLVADVPAKAISLEDQLLLVVPAATGDHVERRITEACAGLETRETLIPVAIQVIEA